MANAMFGFDRLSVGAMALPVERGRFDVNLLAAVSRQRLATDPVGTVAVTFTGVKAGSEIKLFDVDKVLLDGTESASGSPAFTLSRYAAGNARNTVRVLVISLAYIPLEFAIELQVNDFAIPVFQSIDRTYRNP